MTLVNTHLAPLRAEYAGLNDKNESRASRYGAFRAFQEDTTRANGIISTDALEKARRSFGTSVEIPVIDSETISIGSTMSCVVTPAENTSQLVTLTFVPYSFGMTMVKAQYEQNSIAFQQDFNRKMKDRLLALAAVIDTQSVATLEAQKNQHFPATITTDFGYTALADALQVEQAEKDDLYNNVSAIMEVMDYYDEIKVIHNPPHTPLVARNQNQGGSNGTNQGFQFSGYDWNATNRVTNVVTAQSTAYFVNKGSLAVVNRNQPEAKQGLKSTDGSEWDLATNLPFVNLDMGVKYNSTCSDQSVLGGGAADASLLESWQFYTEVAYITPYNSAIATTFQPILKAEVTLL